MTVLGRSLKADEGVEGEGEEKRVPEVAPDSLMILFWEVGMAVGGVLVLVSTVICGSEVVGVVEREVTEGL